MGELTLGGSEFAVYHGTGAPLVDALVECGRYDYVLHGHTHEFGHGDRDGTVRINPSGVPFGGDSGGHYAVVLSTETGEPERFELF